MFFLRVTDKDTENYSMLYGSFILVPSFWRKNTMDNWLQWFRILSMIWVWSCGFVLKVHITHKGWNISVFLPMFLKWQDLMTRFNIVIHKKSYPIFKAPQMIKESTLLSNRRNSRHLVFSSPEGEQWETSPTVIQVQISGQFVSRY